MFNKIHLTVNRSSRASGGAASAPAPWLTRALSLSVLTPSDAKAHHARSAFHVAAPVHTCKGEATVCGARYFDEDQPPTGAAIGW